MNIIDDLSERIELANAKISNILMHPRERESKKTLVRIFDTLKAIKYTSSRLLDTDVKTALMESNFQMDSLDFLAQNIDVIGLDELNSFYSSAGKFLNNLNDKYSIHRIVNASNNSNTKSNQVADKISENEYRRYIDQLEQQNSKITERLEDLSKFRDEIYNAARDVNRRGEDLIEKLNMNVEHSKKLLEEATNLNEKYKTAAVHSTSELLQTKFQARANEVEKQKKYWRWVVYVTGFIAFAATALMILDPFKLFHLELGSQSAVIVLRTIIAFATYILFGFAINQYNKEREIEEAYRFKETIAFSIPNFRDIAFDNGLKDSLLEESAHVVFNSPYESHHKIKANRKSNNEDVLKSLDVLERAQKIIQSLGAKN